MYEVGKSCLTRAILSDHFQQQGGGRKNDAQAWLLAWLTWQAQLSNAHDILLWRAKAYHTGL